MQLEGGKGGDASPNPQVEVKRLQEFLLPAGGTAEMPKDLKTAARNVARRAIRETTDEGWAAVKASLEERLDIPRRTDHIRVLQLVLRDGESESNLDRDMSGLTHGDAKGMVYNALNRISQDPTLMRPVLEREIELESAPALSREQMRWALYRMPQTDRDRIIALIPPNPQVENRLRDRELAQDTFGDNMSSEEAAGKYGLSVNGVKTTVGAMLERLVERPIARTRADAYIKRAASVLPVEADRVRGMLAGLSPDERKEVIESVPECAWDLKVTARLHKQIVSEYFERTDWSVAKFIAEYNQRHPEAELKQRAAEGAIKNMLQRISNEPAARQRLVELSPQMRKTEEPPRQMDVPLMELPTPAPQPETERRVETAPKSAPAEERITVPEPLQTAPPQPIEPPEQVKQPERKPESIPPTQPAPPEVKPPETQMPEEKPPEKILPQEPSAVRAPSLAQPKAATQQPAHKQTDIERIRIRLGDIRTFDDFDGALRLFGNRFSHNMKAALKAAGFEHDRELKDALARLPNPRKADNLWADIYRGVQAGGEAVPIAVSFLMTQPPETAGKVLGHLEDSLIGFMAESTGFQDVPRIALYSTLAHYAGEHPEALHGDAALAQKAKTVAAEYDGLTEDLPASESVKAEYKRALMIYRGIAAAIKPRQTV